MVGILGVLDAKTKGHGSPSAYCKLSWPTFFRTACRSAYLDASPGIVLCPCCDTWAVRICHCRLVQTMPC
jgi:hypothetical protein